MVFQTESIIYYIQIFEKHEFLANCIENNLYIYIKRFIRFYVAERGKPYKNPIDGHNKKSTKLSNGLCETTVGTDCKESRSKSFDKYASSLL